MNPTHSQHTGLQPQSIQSLFNISDKPGPHYFSPEIEDAIWTQLEARFPAYSGHPLWDFMYKQYVINDDYLLLKTLPPTEYWETIHTALLLILVSEGKSIT